MQAPKVGFYILARDKAQHIRRSIDSALSQTYGPLTIYLSDQGSTDGTREILDEYATQYSGPHHIVRMDCPDRTPKSMTALLRHFNWAMDATPDCDLMLIQSADDYCHPKRAELTVQTWINFKPSYIGSVCRFEDPDGNPDTVTYSLHQDAGYATGKQILDKRIGGSSTCAFDREFWNLIRPVTDLMLPDVAMPFMASQDRGFYMIPQDVGVYVRHKGPDNTGLEGQMLGLDSDAEKLRMAELMACEVTTGLAGLLQPYAEQKLAFKYKEDHDALQEHLIQGLITWAVTRRNLHAMGLSPMGRPA